MSNNPVKYEVLIKQYLRSILVILFASDDRLPFVARFERQSLLQNLAPCFSPIGHVQYIYQYSNIAPGLSKQTTIFGVVFFSCIQISLGIEGQKKLKKIEIFSRKSRSHVRILIFQTWPIPRLVPQRATAFLLERAETFFFQETAEMFTEIY